MSPAASERGVELRGIFAAGCAHRPADVMESAQDATAAALHALQAGRRLSHVE
jgi:heterodisulfide reductase subunit A-like polyferredoxin